MKKCLMAVSLFLLMAGYSFAGTGQNVYGTIEGRIMGAVVTVARTDCGISTLVAQETPNKDGSFVVEDLPKGVYLISVRSNKYEYSPLFIEVVLPGVNKEIIFTSK